MNLHDHTGIKTHRMTVTLRGFDGRPTDRKVYAVDRAGVRLGYVAKSASGSGWSYAMDEPTKLSDWTWAGMGTKKADAVDRLLSARSPSASWLV